MKKLYIFCLLFLIAFTAKAQYVTIPDANFREILKKKYPSCFNASGMMDTTCSEIVNEDTLIYWAGFYEYWAEVTDLSGLRFFKNLTHLNLNEGFNKATTISEFPPLLEALFCSSLTDLDSLLNLPNSLKYLNCSFSYRLQNISNLPDNLTYLDLTNCSGLLSIPNVPNGLQYLNCRGADQLLGLPDLSNCSLTYLKCPGSYNFQNLPNLPTTLEYLDCSSTGVSSLPALPNSLKHLDCSRNGLLKSLPTLPPNLDSLNCTFCSLSDLPILPDNLSYINCRNNILSSLPDLPTGLKTLNCSFNSLTTLPVIPNSLKELNFLKNNITIFPALPNTLEYLDCSINPLYTIPVLPDSLKTLFCYGNFLDSLPVLPSYLSQLYCIDNKLTQLPALPSFLTYLGCWNNQLLSLPLLPDTLQYLSCYNNKLTELPPLPRSLITLDCHGNNIFCLPPFPQVQIQVTSPHIQRIMFDYGKIRCLPNKPAHFYFEFVDSIGNHFNATQLPLCSPVNNIHHCQSFALIQGNVFGDMNSNGTKDANEFYFPNVNIQLSNGNNVYTDKEGHYEIGTYDTGHHTLTVVPPHSYYTALPATENYNFTRYDTLVTTNIALQPNASIDSFTINLHEINWAARPGFAYPYLVSYQNVGTTTLAPSIAIDYDNNLFTYDSSSNHNVLSNGVSLSLSESNMLPGEQRNFVVYLKVKTTAPQGSWFTNMATISANSATTKDSTLAQIRGSFDPNDKQATPILSTQQVNSGTYINYTIRFQNTGTDTAFNIVVTDTLTNMLQANTFELINSSHPCNITRDANKLVFEFLNVLLPDSNINEPGSHGFINFRIKPVAPLPLNTIINNKAYIYFDYNLPVITNTVQTFIQNNVTVPVRLVNFFVSAQTDGTTNILWITANEINTKLYILQESTDGISYKDLATIIAKKSINNNYSTRSVTPDAPVVYYRLKIVNADGTHYYSSTITLKTQPFNKGLIVTSKPQSHEMILNVQNETLVNTTVRIISLQGVVVKSIQLKRGVQSINVGGLPPGNYYLQTQYGSEKIIVK